ncbi:ricin-type beta-trefoil lectin domain protein [Streptacidiphilus sp. MAP12-16]|uniref:ricin-type beta-trefoil lectin domain protein n=1 Tax=Streptacidiphilus sp. MAP12-16 TaxID=3156300 RepID=UPI003518E7D7
MQTLRVIAAGSAAVLLAMTTSTGTASAQPTTSSDAFNSLTTENHADWMAQVPDQTGLGALSVPGTHDTLAIHGGLAPAAYEAQEDHGDGAASLDAQLNAGIRAIDIRVRVVNGGTAFAIHHTDVYQNANFDDVLTHARSFLSAHPGESILMDLHGECDADTTEGGSGSSSIGHCADDPSNITAADRIRILAGYVSRYPGLFYAPTVTGSSTAGMPTVGQVRGHVVLADFTGPRGEMYSGYGLTQLTTGNSGQYVENDWTQCGLAQKWSEAQANLVAASNDTTGSMYTTYTSANCSPFGAGPADMAGGYFGGSGVNQRALDYLNSGGAARTGVVLTDYPGHALIDAIISRNPGASLSGPVASAVSGKCLDDFNASAAPGATVDLWSCNGSAAQWWNWSFVGGTLRVNGLCLDVTGGNTAAGTPVELWTCNGGANQQWSQASGGELVSPQSGECLDDPASATADGTRLEIWPCNSGANQHWSLP